MTRFRRFHTPVVAVAALALGIALSPAGNAVAAVKSVLLGTKNTAASTTTISNSRGTALALNSPSGKAPLAVNSTGKVTNLNADRLDGLDSSAFARAGGQTGYIVAPDDVAACPAGTVITGGGGIAYDASGNPAPLYYSGPSLTDSGFVPDTWLAYGPDGGDFYSVAVCYNPKGAVPGAMSAKAVQKLLAKTRAVARTSR
jgi:hypothetical protein